MGSDGVVSVIKGAPDNGAFQFFAKESIPVSYTHLGIEMIVNVYNGTKKVFARTGRPLSIADEGGFWPTGFTCNEAVSYTHLAAMTIRRDSTLAQMADVVVEIPAYTDKVECKIKKKPILPGGTMFEQCILLLGDTMILPLAEKAKIPTDQAFTRHANLE